jgi:hypothetical protein
VASALLHRRGQPVNKSPRSVAAVPAQLKAASASRDAYDPRKNLRRSARLIQRGAGHVLQRKVGFEFETDDLVIKAPGNIVGLHAPIVKGSNWGMYLDYMPSHEDYNNKDSPYRSIGHAEFVTDAFEEDDEGAKQLYTAMKEIESFVGYIAAQESRWKSSVDVPLHKFLGKQADWSNEVGGNQRRNDIVVEIRNGKVTASPQVSAGIKLGATLDLLQGMEKAGFLGRPGLEAQQQFYADVTGGASKLVSLDSAAGGPPDSWSKLQRTEYAGAVSQLADIIVRGGLMKVEHEKYVSALLSRTNYGNLPTFIRGYQHFKRDVLILGAATESRKLFAAGIKFSGLTVGAWLDHIIAGKDTLQWGQAEKVERWKPQLVGPADNRGWGTVFEFRAIAGDLPFDAWKDFAMQKLAYFRELNKSVKTSENVDYGAYGPDYAIWSAIPDLTPVSTPSSSSPLSNVASSTSIALSSSSLNTN